MRGSLEKHMNEDFFTHIDSTVLDRCALTTKLVANCWAANIADKKML